MILPWKLFVLLRNSWFLHDLILEKISFAKEDMFLHDLTIAKQEFCRFHEPDGQHCSVDLVKSCCHAHDPITDSHPCQGVHIRFVCVHCG